MIIQTDYIVKKKTYIAPTLTTFRVSAAQMVCTSYTVPSIPVDGGEDNGQDAGSSFSNRNESWDADNWSDTNI